MKKIIIPLIMNLLLTCFCFANKEIIYNSKKGYYEAWDKEKGRVIKIIIDDALSCSKQDTPKILLYPYLKGWPVQIPGGAEPYPLTIGNFNEDFYKELYVQTTCYGNYIFDYQGNQMAHTDYNYGGCLSLIDFDFDGLNEIVGPKGCSPELCGITVQKYNGESFNGFPNPPKTAMVSVATEDIDRDGNYEIAFAPYEKMDINDYHLGLYILGSWGGILPGFPLRFPFADPATPAPGGENYVSPSIGDFDDDGMMEIAVGAADSRLYLIRADGSHYRNWPIVLYMGALDASPPAIGDIDNDGKLEIAITDSNFLNKLFVFKEDASILKGFPVDIYHPSYQSPSLADINNDGKLELFAANLFGQIFAFDNGGANLPGWPAYLGYCVGYSNAPSIGDIDGDGQMEVIAAGGTCTGCPDGVLVAYKADGTLISGFPIIEPHYDFGGIGASLADLDNNGNIEICTASEHCLHSEDPAYVYCWDLPFPYDETKIAWNGYAHDNQHTGRYVNPAIKPPLVKSITPSSGSYKGGDTVAIAGDNFMPGAKVFFDGIQSNDVQVKDSSTIYAKTPAHRPCPFYINELSRSPYELSDQLAHQKVQMQDRNIAPEKIEKQDYYSSLKDQEQKLNKKSLESYLPTNNNAPGGCLVNVVVAHPGPDQREGILRAKFAYSGYEPPQDDIVLTVKKHLQKGTFENGGAEWEMMGGEELNPMGLWHIVNDGQSNCISRFGSNNKFAWYGSEDTCNYDLGWDLRSEGWLMSPPLYVENADAAMIFQYYRDIYPYYGDHIDKTVVKVNVMGQQANWITVWYKDSFNPSEKQWTSSPWIPLGQFANKYIQVMFYFDGVVGGLRNHKGWAIDDVSFRGVKWYMDTGEVILEWIGGLPKYFVYRSTSPDYSMTVPELAGYTAFKQHIENTLNDDQNYYYKIK